MWCGDLMVVVVVDLTWGMGASGVWGKKSLLDYWVVNNSFCARGTFFRTQSETVLRSDSMIEFACTPAVLLIAQWGAVPLGARLTPRHFYPLRLSGDGSMGACQCLTVFGMFACDS